MRSGTLMLLTSNRIISLYVGLKYNSSRLRTLGFIIINGKKTSKAHMLVKDHKLVIIQNYDLVLYLINF